jgi:hypothetical protein
VIPYNVDMLMSNVALTVSHSQLKALPTVVPTILKLAPSVAPRQPYLRPADRLEPPSTVWEKGFTKSSATTGVESTGYNRRNDDTR